MHIFPKWNVLTKMAVGVFALVELSLTLTVCNRNDYLPDFVCNQGFACAINFWGVILLLLCPLS